MRDGLSPTIPVPLSGFLNLSAVSQQARVPRPCFVPQPFLKAPLQSLPLTRIVNPSRGHLLPRGYPPVCRTHRSRPFTDGFTRRPRSRRSSLDSPAAMCSLSTGRNLPPGRAGSQTAEPPFPPASPASKSYSPCESVCTDLGCPMPATDALLGFFPSRDPFRPRILNPPRPEGPSTTPLSADSSAAT
jgi:hypothetical protein